MRPVRAKQLVVVLINIPAGKGNLKAKGSWALPARARQLVVVLISKLAERERVRAKVNLEVHQEQPQSRLRLADLQKARVIPGSRSKDYKKGRPARVAFKVAPANRLLGSNLVPARKGKAKAQPEP